MNLRLRDYQSRAVANIGRCLAESKSTLLVLPTGCGKTVVFAHAIKEHCAGRAMVIAHREELITQNAKTIGSVLGQPCDIERADQHADLHTMHGKAKVVVASKDSLHPKRLERFDPSEFGMIVTDESHRAVAQSYRRIYDHFKNVPHLGVTATPDRLDEEALGQIYGSVAMVYEIADAIKDGWLVSVRARTVVVHDLDLSDVSTTGGDLNQGELAEQLERERSTHEMAASITKECDDRRAIVFAVTVRQARRMAEILNDYKPDCARWVSGETPTEERRQTLAAHKRGECQFMVNVGVLTEGYDDPGVGMIVVARPTKSRALFAQMLGRGTRALPGVVDGPETAELRKRAIAESEKQDLLCLDFTGNCGRHKLITPADVLGGAFPDEDRAAVSLAMQAGIVDVDDELERARAARKNQGSKADQALYLSSKNRIVALASYMLKPEDLFDVEFTPGRERTWLMGKAPTDPQLDALERAGFKRADCERMSRTECSRLIGEIILRRQQGLCTLKQARCLSQRGVKNAGRLTFEQAREHLDRLYGSRV